MQMLISRNDISLILWLKMIIWVTEVLRRTVVGEWCFDRLCGNHLKSQVKMWPPHKFRWFPLKWRYLLHRLSRRCQQQLVLLKTAVTKMIIFDQSMLLLSSNHFLISEFYLELLRSFDVNTHTCDTLQIQ